MSALSRNIRSLYFEFGPAAGHDPSCSRAGSHLWEVTRYIRYGFGPGDEVKETTFRLACHECGVMRFESIDGEMSSTETTNASQIGYGSRPEKLAGLWLWPGPLLTYWDQEHGPTAYYVTTGKDRPGQAADVAGAVGWHLGPRGGTRWGAGLGLTDHGNVRTSSGQEFTSRRAAVAWIAAQLAGGAQ